MDVASRAFFEPRLGHDLGQVRVHADARAAASAEAMDAHAFTVGRQIVFGQGRYAPATNAGRRLLAHELAHVVQQRVLGSAGQSEPTGSLLQRQPAQQSLRDQICYRPTAAPSHRQPSDCDARDPGNCATYEQWLNTFGRLTTSSARDTAPGDGHETGHRILGQRAARPVDDPQAAAATLPPPHLRPQAADAFIDHPTNQWVATCLPDNLRETAYRLPSDCADIAVILRHVWLSSHRRTEQYGSWVIGDRAGGARREQVGQIIGQVFSGNVHRMVNPYTDPSGRPLQTFAALQDLLHPGDILVWEHHDRGLGTARTGGHTQTIVSVTRVNGIVTRIDVVQGNQPIFAQQAQEIRSHIGRGAPSEETLRRAPGRRIESNSLRGDNLRDHELPPRPGHASSIPRPRLWTWADGHTTLVVAGPPAAARRPAMRRLGGQMLRRISDWFVPLAQATRQTMHGILEAALLETRAVVESGQTVLDADATTLGRTAGERLWTMARGAGKSNAGDLADETHFRPLQQMRAMIRALGDPWRDSGSSTATPSSAAVRRIFEMIDASFHLAARGASSISFRMIRGGQNLLRVLVTGFDPFTSRGPVPPGEVNPSGAAALAMDNTEVREGQKVAAVEGVVLPVDFEDFRTGMVETVVRPLVQSRGVDAVLTVSLDASIEPDEPVRIERFVVGVHERDRSVEPIAASSPAGLGPAIIGTNAPVEDIAAETARQGSRRAPAIPRPEIGDAVKFQFRTLAAAEQAATTLGLPRPIGRELTISNTSALREIVRTMRRAPDGLHILFQIGGRWFQAAVLSGPGGNFLSNEISYRVLRLLIEENRQDLPSFHVHVQRPLRGGGQIPPDTGTPAARHARRQAIAEAMGVRNRLITTLQRMIRAVIRRIAP
jgi:hypothetical protein